MAIKLTLSTDLNLKQVTHLKPHPKSDAGLQNQYFCLMKLARLVRRRVKPALFLCPRSREATAQYPAYRKLKEEMEQHLSL